MELQKTVIQSQQIKLTDNDQNEIVKFVKQCWDSGKQDRVTYEQHWAKCEKAFLCQSEPVNHPEMKWVSTKFLPWAADAVKSFLAHIKSTTMPKDDQIFTINGRENDDDDGALVMQEYLEYRFEENRFPDQLGAALDQLAKKNHTCMKVYWREDVVISHEWQQNVDPLTGQPFMAKRPVEKVGFNNVWIDVIDINNFVMYPIYGDFNKTTRIHESYQFYEDLIATSEAKPGVYFNLNEITLDDENKTINPGRKEENYENQNSQRHKGLNIKEAWIHRIKIKDKVYRNYVATIVNDKTLIRFAPNPYLDGRSPFVWMCTEPDNDCLYGYGLLSKGLDLLYAANEMFNDHLNAMAIYRNQPHKFWDDGIFNPSNVICRPGAMIEMTQESVTAGNVMPLIPNLAPQQQTLVDIETLKREFEAVTVPAVVKGIIETQRQNTATEISHAQNNSSGKMHIDAFEINQKILKPALELSYMLIYDRIHIDPRVAKEIQEITKKLPNPLPLPDVDIKIVGYQNVIRKQEQAQNMNTFITTAMQSPWAKFLKGYKILEKGAQLLDLDASEILLDQEQREAIEAQEQAAQEAVQRQQELVQQLEIQKQTEELRLKAEKQQQDFQIKIAELELKRQELDMKTQAATVSSYSENEEIDE